MEAWQAILIGLVQGLTEFLPVSSSGHVALGALFFGVDDMPLTMVLVVHAGTLLATVIALRQDLANLVKETWNGFSHPQAFLDTEEGRTIVGVLVATVPTAVMGLTLEDRVESFS
ncbi:MAG: undecaprenyl-diphosphate phosphatase, partial [Myxococcales bacterium]|nr:undecaprenyl-diphosphate phosphatase [Myxococcales bacterium]